MALDGVARSDAAVALVGVVSLTIFNRANVGKRGKPSSAHERAVAALVGDLLRNAEDGPAQWGCRSHRATNFTGEPVGYRPYMAAFRGLLAEGLLEFVPGHQQHVEFGGKKVQSWRMCPRLRATAPCLDQAASYNITPANWRDHFDIAPKVSAVIRKPPLECRTPSGRAGSVKTKGTPLPIDLTDPEVLAIHSQVVRINEFMAKHVISGESHLGFQRIFAALGGTVRWDKGGRLYSVGHDNYQRAKKAARADMTINGQPVVELDLTASHLTILHALSDQPFDPSIDPYSVDDIPRRVVKRWVTMTLGHDKLHRSWPKAVQDDLDEGVGGSLVRAFPLRRTRDTILKKLPLLAEWETNRIDWGDLQYVESQVILRTVETLAFIHGVVCLPVYDSVIVAAQHQALASRVLMEAFRSVVGVTPNLKVA